MKRKEQLEEHRDYIESEGLHGLIDFLENPDYRERACDATSDELSIPFPPQPADLVRLHKLVRDRKCFTVLEFGTGYSSIAIADALQKNQRDWEAQARKPEIRNRFMFQLFCVDASGKWIERVRNAFPARLADRVHFHYSEVAAGTHNGQLCHRYERLPDVVPDFIYLDGPSAKDVKGNVNGLSFQCDERTVMSGDLLLMESTFLPGTFILVDGRTNNARFLERNFTRSYDVEWDREGDMTTFELVEERSGRFPYYCPADRDARTA